MESKQGTAPDASTDKDGSGKTAWSSAVNTLNSWYKSEDGPPQEGANANRTKTKPLKTADDHLTTPMYGQSFRSYPKGCPPLRVQWFHAVDVSSVNFNFFYVITDCGVGPETKHAADSSGECVRKQQEQAAGKAQEVYRVFQI